MTFKIILSGVSGQIGSEVLQQCLDDSSVTSIVALARRPLPLRDDRLELIVMDDFTQYSDDVLAKLSGADGCVWYCRTANSVTGDNELMIRKVYDHDSSGPEIRARVS
jgi:nucleoside-diphosphate-sugar epimerase